LILLSSAALSDPAPPGFIEGHEKILPLRDANLADDANPTKSEMAQPYSEYSLIIRSRDGKKEITQVTVDRNGNYRVELPPGNYFLEVQGPESRPSRVKPQPFTIVSGQTTRVDMSIDTGIR